MVKELRQSFIRLQTSDLNSHPAHLGRFISDAAADAADHSIRLAFDGRNERRRKGGG